MSNRRIAWGVGAAYRFCIHDEIMRCASLIDFLELPAEDYVYADRRAKIDPDGALLEEACKRFPVVGHGNYMSIGSAQPANPVYADAVVAFAHDTPVSEYSDHLSWTRIDDDQIDCFVAIPFTDLGVAAAVENAKRLARRLPVPLLLENVTYDFAFPHGQFTEPQFITRVVEAADIGIMLDIANVFINASNHKYNPFRFIRDLPGERVLQSHFCGAMQEPDGYFMDTHAENTRDEIWTLIDYTLQHTSLRALIFERDDKFHPFNVVMSELWKAKEIFLRHRPAQPTAEAERDLAARTARIDASYAGDDSVYAADLKAFQRTAMRVLTDASLGAAIDREGESALNHTGLDRDERRILAAIPPKDRERLGERVRYHLREREGKKPRREHAA